MSRTSIGREIAQQRSAPRRAPSSALIIRSGAADRSWYANLPETDVHIQSLVVDGGAPFSSAIVQHVFSDIRGQRVSGEVLKASAARITRAHRNAGYPLIYASIPAQSFANGVVTISLTAGDIDAPEIRGASTRTARILRGYSRMLSDEKPLRTETIEAFIAKANDLPGVSCKVEVSGPSAIDPRARVVVLVTQDRTSASLAIDNRGPQGIGRNLIFANATRNDVFAGADEAEVLLIHNVGRGEGFLIDASYRAPLNYRGLSAAVSLFRSRIRPRLSGVAPPEFAIEFDNVAASLRHRIYGSNALRVGFDAGFKLETAVRRVDGVTQVRDRRALSFFVAEVNVADPWGGSNFALARWNRGWDAFDATARGSPLASRPGEGAAFSTVIVELGRVQKIGAFGELEFASWSQFATQPLFEADQCVYGGRDFGLGHEFETLYGDECFLGLLELRMSPKRLRADGPSIAPYAFVDGALVGFNGPKPAFALPVNALMSAGLGARIGVNDMVTARLEANWPLRRSGIDFSTNEQRFYFRLEADF